MPSGETIWLLPGRDQIGMMAGIRLEQAAGIIGIRRQVEDPVLDADMTLTAAPSVHMFDRDQDSPTSAERPFGLQALDVKLGKFGRLGLVVILAMGVAITFAAMLAISDALSRLL